MSSTEKTLTPGQSLLLIADAIAKTKDTVKENSFPFILWGWLITLASFSYFILQQYTSFEYYFIPFPLLAATGIIATQSWFFKKRSTQATESYLSFYLRQLWLVLGICFMLVVFLHVAQRTVPFTYTLLLAGIGTLVSGLIMRFRPLTAGGIVFLAAAVVSIYIPAEYRSFLHGVVFVAGYLVPGYLLKKEKV